MLASLIPLADRRLAMRNVSAFIAVCVCMLVMRRRAPDAERAPYTRRTAVGILAYWAASICSTAAAANPIWFVSVQIVGLVVYFAYGARRSVAGEIAA